MTAMDTEAYFAQSYAEARAQFTAAAEAASLDVQAHVHPLVGPDGEVLAMDVARFGPADARALLVITSACHGAEGFCGSGVQNALLADAAFHAEASAAGVAVLYVHALNPYGFSWIRRTTQENVDLNRNWQDFDHHGALPANAGYEEIARFVVPATWPPPPENEAGLADYAQRHGERALQAALSQGQYTHPEGLFFGGHRPTWSRQTLRHVLEEHGQRCARLGWIDIHTGLGPSGHGERIFADRNHPVSLARARRWWAADARGDDCVARRPVALQPPRGRRRAARRHQAADARCVLRGHAAVEAAGRDAGARGGAAGRGRAGELELERAAARANRRPSRAQVRSPNRSPMLAHWGPWPRGGQMAWSTQRQRPTARSAGKASAPKWLRCSPSQRLPTAASMRLTWW
jgi:hypothetical protein